MNRNALIGLGAVVGAFLLALIILFLPFFQAVGYFFLVKNPAFWWYLVIGIGLAAFAAHRGYETVGVGILVVALVMAFVGGPMLAGVYAQQDIQASQTFEHTDSIPDADTEHLRVVPRTVADQYAQSSMQYPVYALSESDITYQDDRYMWSYGLVPDRIMVSWQGQQTGSMYVNMETEQKDVTPRAEEGLRCGQGQIFVDNYNYKMVLSRLDASHKTHTAFNFIHDGEPYIAQSYITYDWGFKLAPIPQPYAVPEYGGTMVIDSECNVEDLSPEEVQEDPRFVGENVYPYSLSTFRVESERLEHGIWNALFVGRDVPQIANVPAQGNSQPFTVPTVGENGSPELTYYVAAEPSGSGSGVYRIYTVDSHSGDIQYVEYDDTQIGPEKAANFVRKENPRVNWVQGESGTMEVSELIPIIQNGTLYWKASVVPTDSSGIAYTSFVNADTGDVREFRGDSEIYGFVQSGEMVRNVTSDESQPSEGGMVVAVVSPNGTVVDTIEVPENGSVRVNNNE